MKDLFKKKQSKKQPDEAKSSKSAKPGFSLSLGKKSAKAESEKPKKSGLSFGKKAVAEPQNDEAVASTPSVPKAKGKAKAKGGKSLDTNKLILILGCLLAVIVLGLGAKMFLFAEEPAPPPPVVETTPPPAEMSPPADPVPPASPEGVSAAPALATQSVPPVADPNQVVPPVEAPVSSAPVVPAVASAPVAPATATPAPTGGVAPSASTKISQEEFLQESDRRIYRERNTGTGQ